MKIERPMDMARRIVGDTCAAEDGRVLYEEAIRARDTQVLQALGFALAHADPFPMLRGLAEDLGGEVRACSRCGDALGAEEIGGTCEGQTSGRCTPRSPPTRCADPACQDARFPHHHGETTAAHREHGLTVTTYLPPTPSRARLIVDGHSVMCAEFGGDGPTAGCPGCALPPRSLSAQVRARLGNGDLSILMNTSRPASRIFSATWHREYPDGVVSDRRDAEGPDVDACLRAVLAWEDSADREQPEHAPPAVPGATEESLPALRARVERLGQRVAAVTSIRPHGERGVWDREYDNARAELARRDAEPSPTEHVDMALRFRYAHGCFYVPNRDILPATWPARPDLYRVHGLRVRIVYEHSAADVEAAQDCAESWRIQMLGAGAMEVECVGEVEK